jgi:hypothetical protein
VSGYGQCLLTLAAADAYFICGTCCLQSTACAACLHIKCQYDWDYLVASTINGCGCLQICICPTQLSQHIALACLQHGDAYMREHVESLKGRGTCSFPSNAC